MIGVKKFENENRHKGMIATKVLGATVCLNILYPR